MQDQQPIAPDNTAIRTALWRALHVQADPPPHVFKDEVGLQLAVPEEGWQSRPDMSPFTRPFRASILARARFVEDLIEEQAARGVGGPVDFEAGQTWWERLEQSGFDSYRPAVVVSTGVSMYLTRDAIMATLRQVAARASGTPFISFFTPEQMLAMAREAGFESVEHVSAASLAERYFAGRSDGLRPPNNSEEMLVARS